MKDRIKAFYEDHKYEVTITGLCAVVTTIAALNVKRTSGLEPVMAAIMEQPDGATPHTCVLLKNGDHRDFPVFTIPVS